MPTLDFKNPAKLSAVKMAESMLQQVFENWQQERIENYNLISGHIFSEMDIRKLRKERRPDFEYNIAHPIINQVVGNFRNSLPGVTILPKTPNDMKTVDLFKSLNDWILYQSNETGYELSKAFLDALIGRIGWIRQDWIVNENHPNGYIRLMRVEPFSIKFDPSTRRRDLQDCKIISNSEWLSPEDIILIYANDNKELRQYIEDEAIKVFGYSSIDKNQVATWQERVFNLKKDYLKGKRGYDNMDLSGGNARDLWMNQRNGFLKVIDWYERKLVKSMILTDNDNGKTIDITEDVKVPGVNGEKDTINEEKLAAIQAQIPNSTLSERYIQKIYQTSVCPGLNVVLYDAPQAVQNNNFKFTPIFSYDFHTSIMEMKSLVDNIKELVRSYTLRRNTMLTSMQKSAVGGWYAEEGAILDHIDEWTENTIGGTRLVKNGFIEKVRPMPAPQFPASLDTFSREDVDALKMISGVPDNARGQAEQAGESGTLFRQRVAQSELMGVWISDNAQAALKTIVQNNIAFIQTYFTENMVFRISGDDEDLQWLEINKPTIGGLLNDTSYGNFDVVLAAVPYGKMAKDNEFAKLIELMSLLGKVNPAYVDPTIILKYADVVGKNELIKIIGQIKQQEDAKAQQAQQMQIQQAQAQVQQTAAVTDKMQAETIGKKVDAVHAVTAPQTELAIAQADREHETALKLAELANQSQGPMQQ